MEPIGGERNGKKRRRGGKNEKKVRDSKISLRPEINKFLAKALQMPLYDCKFRGKGIKFTSSLLEVFGDIPR